MKKKVYSPYQKLKKELKLGKWKACTTAALIFYSACLFCTIMQIQRLVDLVAASSAVLSWTLLFHFLLLLGLLFAACCLSQLLFNRLPVVGKKRLLLLLYERLLHRSPAAAHSCSQAETASVFQNDAPALAGLIATCDVVFWYQGGTMLLCFLLLCYYQPLLTMILIVFLITCFALTSLLAKGISRYAKKSYEKKEEVLQRVLESLRTFSIIRQLRRESIFYRRFHRFIQTEAMACEGTLADLNAVYMTIYILLSIGVPLLCLGIGVFFISRDMMSIGELLAMYALSSQLQEPVRMIAETRTNQKIGIQLAERVCHILDEEEAEEQNREITEPLRQLHVVIPSFCYGEKEVLKDIDLTVRKEDCLLVEGESGCGKTTLASLLLRFQELQRGCIMLNEVDSASLSYAQLTRHILLAEQTPQLFQATLWDNITVYEDFSEEDVLEVARVCQLEQVIEEHGWEYMIKEDSGNLSGGQKQRICIARMLLRRPDFLLLDEPTSALDEATGAAFASALKSYAQKYHIGLWIISHRSDVAGICNKRLRLSAVKREDGAA